MQLKYGKVDKSAVALHCIDNNHLGIEIETSNLSLVKNVNKSCKLDGYNSVYINK